MIGLALGEAVPVLVLLAGTLYALRFDPKTDRARWDWRRLL